MSDDQLGHERGEPPIRSARRLRDARRPSALEDMQSRFVRWRGQKTPSEMAVIGFVLGTLLGWVVLGWWIAPVHWRNAGPDALRHDWQQRYVQLVADSFAAEPAGARDVGRAAILLNALKLEPAALSTLMNDLMVDNPDPEDVTHVRELATAVQLPLAAVPGSDVVAGASLAGANPGGADAPAAPSNPALAPADPTPTAAAASAALTDTHTVTQGILAGTTAGGSADSGLLARVMNLLPILALLFMAGAVVLYLASRQRQAQGQTAGGGWGESNAVDALEGWGEREARARRAGRTAPDAGGNRGGRGAAEPEIVDDVEVWDRRTDAAPLRVERPAPTQAVAEPIRLPFGRARTGTTQPWRPGRIDIGDSVSVRVDARDDRLVQTWLLYNARSGLVGGAGLQAQPMGSVGTLVLWVRAQDDEDGTGHTPIVTIVSAAAYEDSVLRARLGDQTVIPAIAGRTTTLETADVALDVQIRDVGPLPDSDPLGLGMVTLALSPRVQAAHERVDALPAVSDADDFDEPPVPLRFQRD